MASLLSLLTQVTSVYIQQVLVVEHYIHLKVVPQANFLPVDFQMVTIIVINAQLKTIVFTVEQPIMLLTSQRLICFSFIARWPTIP